GSDAGRPPSNPEAKIAWPDRPRSDMAAAPARAAAADPTDPVPSAAGAGIPAATTITSGPRAPGPPPPAAAPPPPPPPPQRRPLPAALAGISILAAATVAIAILADPFSHQTGRPPGHVSTKPPSYRITKTLTDPRRPGPGSIQSVYSV